MPTENPENPDELQDSSSVPPSESQGAIEPFIAQSEIDALIAAEREKAAARKAAPPPRRTIPQITAPPSEPIQYSLEGKSDLGLISSDEMDQAVDSARTKPPRPDPPVVTQAPVRVQPTTPPEEPVDSPYLSQEEIDAFIQAEGQADTGAGSVVAAIRESVQSGTGPVAGDLPPATYSLEGVGDLGLVTRKELATALAHGVQSDPSGDAARDDVSAMPFLSQEEIDAFILAEGQEGVAAGSVVDVIRENLQSGGAPVSADHPAAIYSLEGKSDLGPITGEELAAVLSRVQTTTDAAATAAAPPAEEALAPFLSQAEIDAFVGSAGASGAHVESAAAHASFEHPPAIYSLEGKTDLGLVTAAELSTVLAEYNGIDEIAEPRVKKEPAAAHVLEDAGPAADSPLSQADIDALLSGAQPQPAASEPADEETGGALDQSEIDRLLQEAAKPPASRSTAKPTEDGDEAPVVSSVPPDPDSTLSAAGLIDATDMEQLLDEAESEQTLDQSDVDAVLASTTDASMDTVLGGVTSEVADALLSDETLVDELPPPPPEEPIDLMPAPPEKAAEATAPPTDEMEIVSLPESEDHSEALSSDLIDKLLADAAARAAEPVYSSKEESVDIPSSDELDAQTAAPSAKEAVRNDMAVHLTDADLEDMNGGGPAKPKAPEAAAPSKKGPSDREPAGPAAVVRLLERLPHGTAKLASSLAAGVIVGAATFFTLMGSPERPLDEQVLNIEQPLDLRAAMAQAQTKMEEQQYGEAADVLQKAIPLAATDPRLADAEFMRIEARYKGLPEGYTGVEADELHRDIERFVTGAPAYPRNAEALRWRAEMYQRTGNPMSARDIYSDLLQNYGNAPDVDATILGAAKLAMETRQYDDAAQYAARLLEHYPSSPSAPEAMLILGDAAAANGQGVEARKLYERVALEQPHSKLGTDAAIRLGELDLREGKHQHAIQVLEQRLETATIADGNERIYLLLAKAHSAMKDDQKAEEILRELLNFFPESPTTPDALIELAQVLDRMGRRAEALQVSSQASVRYKTNVAVLSNEAELLARAGKQQMASDVWAKAASAGVNDPRAWLSSARAYAALNDWDQAQQAYEQLLTVTVSTPEAFDGHIELANILEKQGLAERALNRLQTLALSTRGRPDQVPAHMALADMYERLGLWNAAADTYSEIALATEDDEVLGRAAIASYESGRLSSANALARRLDVNKLSPRVAYGLLVRQGKSLLLGNAPQAMEKLTDAYRSYPNERTPEGDLALLQALADTDQTERAEQVVMDLAAFETVSPGSVPYLNQAAIIWGDALFDKGDYSGAMDAYDLVESPTEGESNPDADWATYQQANALLKMRRFDESATLYNQVATGGSVWAEEAGIKRDFATLQQRLLETELTPVSRFASNATRPPGV